MLEAQISCQLIDLLVAAELNGWSASSGISKPIVVDAREDNGSH